MISGLIWNVRGIGKMSSVRRIRKLSKINNLSFLCLIEPLVAVNKSQSVRLALHFDSVSVNANNKIWLLTRGRTLIFHILEAADQFLHVRINDTNGSLICYATFVYRKCTPAERCLL